MGKSLTRSAGGLVLLALLGFSSLLVRPGWGVVGVVGLAGLVVFVIVWWLIGVRTHTVADDEATEKEMHVARLEAAQEEATYDQWAAGGFSREPPAL